MKPTLLGLMLTVLCQAQLPAPNASGVAMGHLHFKVRDLEAQKKLWVDVLGATPGKLGRMEMMKIPGAIILFEPGEPSGGTNGSVVGHLGFKVRDLRATLAKARSAGIKLTREVPESRAAFLMGPGEVEIELIEDPSVSGPIVNHHIHFYNPAVDQTKAWYVKTFGATGGKRGKFEAADLPGVNLTFSESEKGAATAPTKGRALDHIGFEVRDLAAFSKKLEAAGVNFDVPYRKIPSLGIAIAFFTDPWGTYIELTEGLDRL
jgi:catechol 2,3-dioxygenase-like lactoylglutathione lyase family enzyme